jgi:carbonic anhydrase
VSNTHAHSHFRASHPFDVAHPHALAVYCSDGRFTHAIEELLAHLGHARLDTVTTPGGPAVLNHMSASYADADTNSRAATFLIRAHHITDVVLLAHQGCGYYRAKRPSDTPDKIYDRQIEDMQQTAKTLVRATPALAVQLFYARVADGHVHFDAVPLAKAP